jgi:hypothetical protein
LRGNMHDGAKNVTIYPPVRMQRIVGGVLARLSDIGLAGFGPDEGRALASVARIAETWARGLTTDGSLSEALRRHRIAFQEGGEAIVAEPRVVERDYEADAISSE